MEIMDEMMQQAPAEEETAPAVEVPVSDESLTPTEEPAETLSEEIDAPEGAESEDADAEDNEESDTEEIDGEEAEEKAAKKVKKIGIAAAIGTIGTIALGAVAFAVVKIIKKR